MTDMIQWGGKIAGRDAWRILQANYSERKNITPDRWHLLDVAFRQVPDDILMRAVLAHIRDSPYFPTVRDLWQCVQAAESVAVPDVTDTLSGDDIVRLAHETQEGVYAGQAAPADVAQVVQLLTGQRRFSRAAALRRRAAHFNIWHDTQETL
ncbi:MAG: hypothetical protein M9930_19015 [Anaerolineae bacterium]|nr:hypothetical protein [Anaerolineae bacterium]